MYQTWCRRALNLRTPVTGDIPEKCYPSGPRGVVMTSWELVILVAALVVGLKNSVQDGMRYGVVIGVVVLALGYAAYRQHIY